MKRLPFNMIEVTLALLVISIGVVSIFGLVPIGYKAHRDAVSNNYSADAADDLLNYLSDKLQEDWDVEKAKFPTGAPADISSATSFPRDINDPKWKDISSVHPNWYNNDDSTSVFRIYVTSQVRHSGGQYRNVTDFDGVVRVWKTTTSAWEYNSGWVEQTDTNCDKRLLLHAEISWPATNPYGDRSKAHYVMEVLRQQ